MSALIMIMGGSAVSGCAAPESRSWAQSSPLIMPEKRPVAEATPRAREPVRGVDARPADGFIQLN